MKHFHRAVVLAFLCCSAAHSQQAGVAPRTLQFSARIISQKYCAGSGEIDFLHLRLQLRYFNAGERRLILYQGHNLFFSVWTNPRPEQDTLANYELKTSVARFLNTGSENVDKSTPTKAFTVLLPGSDHVTEIGISLPVTRGEEERSNASIGAGEHLLQIRAATWYESRELGEKLRGRWRQRGLLWIDPVSAAPILLSSRRPGQVEQCR